MITGNVDFKNVPEEIRRELGHHERVIWSGRPLAGLRLKPSDAFLIPFSLLWGGFAFFWNATVWFTNAPIFFRLWGLPFLLVGIYLIVGRFFVDAKLRARTAYALTERRAIIIAGLRTRSVRSIDLHAVPEIAFSESSNGVGTITFGTSAAFNNGTRNQPPQFEIIENARAVYEQVRAVQLRTKQLPDQAR